MRPPRSGQGDVTPVVPDIVLGGVRRRHGLLARLPSSGRHGVRKPRVRLDELPRSGAGHARSEAERDPFVRSRDHSQRGRWGERGCWRALPWVSGLVRPEAFNRF